MTYIFAPLAPDEAGDCSARGSHKAEHHRPHPRTGRFVCFVCHPPADTLIEERARADA